MANKWVLIMMGAAIGSGALYAQAIPFRASISGGGARGEGKCTIEVVVDQAAQVEVRGDTAVLRTLRGGPSEWRRFQCNIPMPVNPVGLRFEGVDGRGRQQLVRDRRNPGAIVVQIEDPDNGREGYTFDLIWPAGYGGDPRFGGGPAYPNGPGAAVPYPGNRPDDDHRNGGFRPGGFGNFSQREAVEACQDAVRRQALDRFGARNAVFQDVRVEMDRDQDHGSVQGMFETADGPDRGRARDRYRFSCRVDFDGRSVGLINIDPIRRR